VKFFAFTGESGRSIQTVIPTTTVKNPIIIKNILQLAKLELVKLTP
jgi:hypothetical protein